MPSLRLPGRRDLSSLLLSFAFCLSILQSLRTRPAPWATKAGGPARRGSAGAGTRQEPAGGRGSSGCAVPPAAPGSRAPPESPAASREGRPGEFRRLLSIVACRNEKCNSKHLLRAGLKNRSLLSVRFCHRSILRKPELPTASPDGHLEPWPPPTPHKASSDPNLQPLPRLRFSGALQSRSPQQTSGYSASSPNVAFTPTATALSLQPLQGKLLIYPHSPVD